MPRHALRLLLFFVALALVAATASGCGSSSSSSSGLDTALSYIPKDAPVVVAINTDPKGDQWQHVQDLIGKFPGGGQAKQQFKTAFNGRSGFDFDRDFKPQFGNDLVVAYTDASPPPGTTPFVFAWKIKDEDAAKRLIQKNSTKAGTIDGDDVYGTGGTNLSVIRDGVWILADTKASLDAAVKRSDGDDHMTEGDFNASLGNLKQDALVRVIGNVQSLIGTTPDAAAARKVKWIAALRTFGATISADPDGLASAFEVKTDSASLTEKDLPLASGSQPVPVVRRAGEVGFGVRNPAQLYTFGQAVARITNPAGYARFVAQKAKASKQLGVNIDRDVFGQLTGNTAFSIALDGKFAVRADLRDPAAMEATLKKVALNLKKLAKGKPVAVTAPKNGKGFYAITSATGKKYVFGVVGKSFVVATDAARAAQFAGQSPSTVNGAKGAYSLALDARSLANAAAAQRGQGVAAQLITGSLGDLVGWIESETTGLKGQHKLFIR